MLANVSYTHIRNTSSGPGERSAFCIQEVEYPRKSAWAFKIGAFGKEQLVMCRGDGSNLDALLGTLKASAEQSQCVTTAAHTAACILVWRLAEAQHARRSICMHADVHIPDTMTCTTFRALSKVACGCFQVKELYFMCDI